MRAAKVLLRALVVVLLVVVMVTAIIDEGDPANGTPDARLVWSSE